MSELKQPEASWLKVRRLSRGSLRGSFANIDWRPSGKVTDVVGTVVEAHLPGSRLGTVVTIGLKGQKDLLAEVVGFRADKVLLVPYADLTGISPGAPVMVKG